MSFSMMTIQPSISQDVKDNEEWERKKKKQQSQMALAKQRAAPRDPSITAQGGALGIGGLGEQLRASSARSAPVKPTYPTPADLPKYDSLAGAQAGQKQAMNNLLSPGFGQGYSAKPNPKPAASPDMKGLGVTAPPTSSMSEKDLASALTPVTSADNSPISEEQGAKSYGLSITPSPDKNSAAQDFAAAMQGGVGNAIGFDKPSAPRRGTAEAKERDALIKQASTVQAGARGITAAQMNVLSGLQNNDDKFANDQYQAQLGAASNMAQAQTREVNANARAALGEASAAERQGQQLGFDADKFQQSVGLDTRRLDMQQSESDIKNKGTMALNDLYAKYETLETDEERSAIAQQIRALKGTEKPENWVAIKGAQTIQGGLPVDGAPMLLNKTTGETRPIDTAPTSLDMSNPKVADIMNNTDTTYEQKMAELDALGVVTQ